MQLYASHIKATKKDDAKKIVVNFLQLTSKRQFFINSINTYLERGILLILLQIPLSQLNYPVIKIQKVIRSYFERKAAFKKLLMMHWDQQAPGVIAGLNPSR